MQPLPVTIYNTFDRGLYRIGVPVYQTDDGSTVSASGISVSADTDGSSGGSIDPSQIASGGASEITQQYVGAIASGKTQFTNTETGWILGIDKGIPKFYIGNSTNYLNWDGTSLIVSGNITATSGTIGGFTIGATDISATGLDINSSTPKITIGTGVNAITLDGSTGIISSNGSTWALNGNGTTSGIGSLGSWGTPISPNTTYQALTDGFVILTCGFSSIAQVGNVKLITDSSSTPTTIRGYIQTWTGGGTAPVGSCMTPVKKNDYVLISPYTGTATVSYSIYFIPLGN